MTARFARSLLHGLLLAVLDIAAVLVAFGMYRAAFEGSSQIAVQGSLAVILTVIGFLSWGEISRRLPGNWRISARVPELGAIYAWAFVCFPLVFVPLHLAGTGYLTSGANVVSGWSFQALANLLALAALALRDRLGRRGMQRAPGR